MEKLTKQNQKLIKEILALKKEKKALILAHNYQRPEIFPVADFIGDSYGLAIEGKMSDKKMIFFCGVNFMAETAKILSPEKRVFIPSNQAICPMAATVTLENLRKLKAKYPKAATAAYVNTTAEIKAEVDICCTSANAVKIIDSLKEKEVIFVPDKNLAEYVQSKTKKKIIPWEGFCYVHNKIMLNKLLEAKERHPKAEIIVHPECKPEIIEKADAVLSTTGMAEYIKKSKAKEFIIGTEIGMYEVLSNAIKNKKFYFLGGECIQQKKINLENLKECLLLEKNEVLIDEKIRIRAERSLNRMLQVGK